MKDANNLHLTLFLVSLPLIAHSVPDPICDDHFDDGDCGKPPVTMFYYYKSGSRCEMRTWRGCPTLNKFPDQFSCLHFCVARIWGRTDEIPSISSSEEKADEKEKEKTDKIAKVVEDQNKWKEEIKTLDLKDMKKIDEILDNVVDVVDYHVKEKIKEQQVTKENKDPRDKDKKSSSEQPSAEEATTPVNLDLLFAPWASSEMLAHIQGMSEEEVILAQGKK